MSVGYFTVIYIFEKKAYKIVEEIKLETYLEVENKLQIEKVKVDVAKPKFVETCIN